MFDELCKTPFHPCKRKQGHVVEVEDGGLLGFAAFKDLPVTLEEDVEGEVPLDIKDVCWDVYGVGLQDEDEDTDEEDSEQPGEVASSSSSNLPNPPAVISTSSNPASQLLFMYGVDQAVVKAMERGSMHERTHTEFKAICRRHGLSVKGAKGELMWRVESHFHRLYQI